MEDLSEKEQLDALRAWWAENGSYVMGGIIVGIVAIFGWNRWQTGIADTEIAASTLFEEVMEASARGNLDNAAVAADELLEKHASSPYAAQARLAMARMYMDSGRDQDAADVLQGLVDQDPNSELAMVGRLRLAKVLLYQGRNQEVVDLVNGMPDSAFAARFNEVLGDAYVALESYAEAEAAYVAALNDNPQAPTVDVSLIQLKINDLPLLGAAAGATADAGDVAEPAADADAEPEAGTETPAEAEEPAPEGDDATAEDTGEAGEE